MVSSWNFQVLLPLLTVMFVQIIKVRGQRSRSLRAKPHLSISDSSLNSHMSMKWCTMHDVAKKRCHIVFQGHPPNFKVTQDKKIMDFDPNCMFPDCNSNLNSPMARKAWSSIEEVPSCSWRSSVKFQGHRRQKIADFGPNWAFQDCNPSLNSLMALKWCTKLDVV